jgi:hypothetical protein
MKTKQHTTNKHARGVESEDAESQGTDARKQRWVRGDGMGILQMFGSKGPGHETQPPRARAPFYEHLRTIKRSRVPVPSVRPGPGLGKHTNRWAKMGLTVLGRWAVAEIRSGFGGHNREFGRRS